MTQSRRNSNENRPPSWLEIKALVREGHKTRIGFGDGVYLQIIRPNVASWLFRYDSPIFGRERRQGLGSWNIGLAKARERAKKSRELIENGIDPLEHQKTERSRRELEASRNVTFKMFAERCIDKYRSEWRGKVTECGFRQRLRDYVYPVFGDVFVQDVHSNMIAKAIESILPKANTATQTLGNIKRVFDSAVASRLRSDNPAEWRVIQELLPQKLRHTKKHHSSLDYRRMPDLMAELAAIGDNAKTALCPVKGMRPDKCLIPTRCLEFTILTILRVGVVFSLPWSEIDFARKVWVIPPERMKAGRAHNVPLPSRCMEILNEIKATSKGDFVFDNGTRGRSGKAKIFKNKYPNAVGAHITKRALDPLIDHLRKTHGDFVIHGFRATARTFFKTRTDPPMDERRVMLAHAVGNAVDEAYEREDNVEKLRSAFELWAQYCAGNLPLPETGKIIHLRTANG